MRPPPPFLLLRIAFALMASWLALAAAAQPIHKCRHADGTISYQDQPCGDAEALPPPAIAPPPPYTPPPDMPATPQANAPQWEPEPEVAPPPLPAQFHCTTYDGKRYVSSNPNPPARNVPLVALDFPGANRYRRGDITRRGNNEVAPTPRGDAYVWVQDECRPMGRGELCAYWKGQYDETSKNRRLAFNDTRPQLEQEEAGLRSSLDTWCRR